MTAPVPLRSLDEGHRVKQNENAAAVAVLVMQLFAKMIDPKNIVGTAQQWLQQSILAILRGRQSSILLAQAYVMAVRRLEIPDAPSFVIPNPADPPIRQLVESLTYTGPGKLAVDLARLPKPVEPGPSEPHELFAQYDSDLAEWERQLKQLPAVAAASSASAAYRHVQNGGRDLVDSAVASDNLAVGYIRVTRGTPCAFCAMLASRGPVYKDSSFAASDVRFTGLGNHKVHDGCGCTLRPLYGKSSSNWTDEALKFEQLWIGGQDAKGRSPSSYSGKDAINAFARIARKEGIADLTRW